MLTNHRATTLHIALLVSLAALAGGGCNDAGSSIGSDSPASGPSLPANPIAASAYQFLDAVIAGDTTRADQMLTPLASEQLAKTGQRFAPPGEGPTRFEVGDIREFGDGLAAVECQIYGKLAGEELAETLGCLLRQVEGQWLVSGVAYETGPSDPPTIINFEQAEGNQQVARPTNLASETTPAPLR